MFWERDESLRWSVPTMQQPFASTRNEVMAKLRARERGRDKERVRDSEIEKEREYQKGTFRLPSH